MMLRTVWLVKPACAMADSRAVPAMGLAAHVATHPERAGGGEALLAAGSIAAPPASSAAPARTAARRRAAGLIDVKDFISCTSSVVPLTEADCLLTSTNRSIRR